MNVVITVTGSSYRNMCEMDDAAAWWALRNGELNTW